MVYVVHVGPDDRHDKLPPLQSKFASLILDHPLKRGHVIPQNVLKQFQLLQDYPNSHLFIDGVPGKGLDVEILRFISKGHRKDRCVWISLHSSPEDDLDLRPLISDFHVRVPLRTSKGIDCPKIWGLSSIKDDFTTQVYASQALLK